MIMTADLTETKLTLETITLQQRAGLWAQPTFLAAFQEDEDEDENIDEDFDDEDELDDDDLDDDDLDDEEEDDDEEEAEDLDS